MKDSLRDAVVLVTGGTGFIGAHLVRRLVADGANVHLLVRPRSHFDRLADVRVSVAHTALELADKPALAACLRGVQPDVVFHLAGVTAGRGTDARLASAAALLEHSYEVNLTGTLHLLLAVAHEAPAARVIRTGGLAEYGNGPVPFREEQREAPVSPYAASQVAATHLGQSVVRQFGLAVTTVRPALTYGPAQSDSFFIPSLILACLEGRPFDMTTGTQTRDFVYVDDVVGALVAAATAPGVAGQIVNAGSGREVRIDEVASLIVRMTGGRTALRVGAQPGRPGDLERLFCDPERARQLLGWVARTSLDAGLERTIAWYRERRAR